MSNPFVSFTETCRAQMLVWLFVYLNCFCALKNNTRKLWDQKLLFWAFDWNILKTGFLCDTASTENSDWVRKCWKCFRSFITNTKFVSLVTVNYHKLYHKERLNNFYYRSCDILSLPLFTGDSLMAEECVTQADKWHNIRFA